MVVVEGRGAAKVDGAALAHYALAVPGFADCDGGLGGVEGGDDAAEGAEGCPGVQGGDLGDEIADCLEVVGAEDVWVLEVCDDEGVGGLWGGLEGWQVG